MLDSYNELLVAYVFTGTLLYVVSITYASCSIHALILHRKKQYLVKRRPLLVGGTVISELLPTLGLANYYCFLPLLQLLNTNAKNDNSYQFRKQMILICRISDLIFSTFFLIAPMIFLIRVWLLYFDMELSHLLKNKYWQMAINPNEMLKNWFLNPRNQRRFGGNGRVLFAIGLILGLICQLCFLILYLCQFVIPAVCFLFSTIFAEVNFPLYYTLFVPKVSCVLL